MGMLKNKTQLNSVVTGYHRISLYHHDANSQMELVEVSSYVSKASSDAAKSVPVVKPKSYAFSNVSASQAGYAAAYARLMAHADFDGATSDA